MLLPLRISAFAISVFLALPVFAIGPQKEGKFSSFNLGARVSSLVQNRGVIFYNDYQIDPVISLFFMDDQIEFVGDSISAWKFIYGEQVRARVRWQGIGDDPFIPSKQSVREGRPDRPTTNELQLRLETFWPDYYDGYIAQFDIGYARDIGKVYGQYIDVMAKVKLFEFNFPVVNFKAEPNFVANIGWGDARNNAYFYGPDKAKEGVNNISYGVWIAFPDRADRTYPIIQLMRFETVGEFADGAYARGGYDRGILFQALYAYDFKSW